jgi:hypothetical protein
MDRLEVFARGEVSKELVLFSASSETIDLTARSKIDNKTLNKATWEMDLWDVTAHEILRR